MPTKILKEGRIRKIFESKQITPEAIEWLDEHIEELLGMAYKSIKDNDKVKRISKDVLEFLMKPSALVIEDGDNGDDDDN